jgi:putative transposase
LKPKYKRSGNESTIAPNHLKRNFNPTVQNEIWCGDVTYILAGHVLSPDSELTAKALQVAYESRERLEGVIGPRLSCTSLKFRQKLCKYRIKQSMATVYVAAIAIIITYHLQRLKLGMLKLWGVKTWSPES